MTEQVKPERKGALVTGSSRGIGRAIALSLAESGMNVCVNCSSERSLPAAQELAAQISATYGVKSLALVANVASAEEAQTLVESAHVAFGRLDVLVNNAGITRDGLVARMKEEDFDAVIDVNLKGTFNCCKAATKVMMKQRSGRIVNMSSVVGVSGNAGQANYAASKAGRDRHHEVAFPRACAAQCHGERRGARFIETDMTDALSDKQREAISSRIACGRLGQPEDVANLVKFLASDEAGYITGQVICIDGGMAL